MKKCPYCAEEIQNEAKKCKHCSKIIDMNDDLDRKNSKFPKSIKNIVIIIAIFLIIFFVGKFFSNIDNKEINSQINESSFDADGFQITFPQNPKVDEINASGVLNMKQYHATDDKNIDYFVKIGRYDDDFMNNVRSKPAFLEYFLSKFPQNLFTSADKNSAVISSERSIFFNNYQGIEYKYKSEIDGSWIYRRGIFFMTDDRSFQISVNYPESFDSGIDDNYNNFIRSLKIKK